MALRDALLPEYDHEMASTAWRPASRSSRPAAAGGAEGFASREALLRDFDDAAMMRPWTFLNDGHVVFTMPKAAVLRSFFTNHLIHDRGQLCVYLRLRDVPLPGLYGPTADEG